MTKERELVEALAAEHQRTCESCQIDGELTVEVGNWGHTSSHRVTLKTVYDIAPQQDTLPMADEQ